MNTLVAATTVHIDSTILAMALGSVIPVLTQVVTKLRASASTRAMIQAMLAAVAGVGATAAIQGGDINWQNALLNVGLAWTVAVATHFGLVVPSGLAVRVAARTAHVGVAARPVPAGPLPAPGPVSAADVGQITMTPDNTAQPVYTTRPSTNTAP